MHTVYIPGNLHAGSTEVSFSCQKFCVYLWVYDRVKQKLYSYIDFCIMFEMAKPPEKKKENKNRDYYTFREMNDIVYQLNDEWCLLCGVSVVCESWRRMINYYKVSITKDQLNSAKTPRNFVYGS